ncbi:DUF3008 family protein [Aurantimonas sp. C2-3-R2]|uniref:DUF3008 family protein n=1 Tax=unclassified Aurantimonas TaxID=2638230 RepID=UPI003FA40782
MSQFTNSLPHAVDFSQPISTQPAPHNLQPIPAASRSEKELDAMASTTRKGKPEHASKG